VITLLDNTVMSNFAVIERPDALRRAFSSGLATPQQAFDELLAGVRLGRLPDLDWTWLPKVYLTRLRSRPTILTNK
jgi:hypothetical protein